MKQYILTLISVVLLLSSCSLIDESLPACQEDAEPALFLSFRMMTSRTGARSDEYHDETGSEYVSFEDAIDIDDLGLFIFAKIKNSPDAEKLVFKTADIKSITNDRLTIAGVPSSLLVNMTIYRQDLINAIGVAPDPNSANDVTFRVLIVANGSKSEDDWKAISGDFTSVISKLDNWNFDMTGVYDADGLDDVTALYKNYMPMFGTQTFNVNQKVLSDSRLDKRINLGDIEMLRSLAKVRVVDNFQNKTEAGYPKIVEATFIGTQDMAKQLPYEADSYINGTQVHAPNISSPDNVNTFAYRLGTIPDGWIEPVVSKTGDVRIGFVPEQSINGKVKGLPVFRLTIARYKDKNGSDYTETYDVAMNAYKGYEFDFGDNVLRNHIYTLSVLGFDAASLKLDVIVDPWVVRENDIEF